MGPHYKVWWRWGPPLVLISLKNAIERRKIPTKIPTSDRLRINL